MPFGLKTAPALFTKAIRKLLSAQFGDEAFKKMMGNATLDADDYAFAYMDDIIIFSDDEESHVQHVADVLRRIREFGLKVSAEKCHLFKQEVRYLGHIISTKGTRMDPDKVSVLRNIPLAQTVTALHSFIATVGFYKNFFGMKFVELAKPLRKMVQEGNMNWTKSAIKKFEMMKDMITNEKFLTPPDWNKRFFLETDASAYALGGCCYQYDEEGRKKPVMWMGRKLTKPEVNYCTRDQELLAVVYCIARSRMFLFGREFTVRSDHLNLLWLYENDVSGRVARWAAKLTAYDFQIEHIKGKDNIVADGMSRIRGATALVMTMTPDIAIHETIERFIAVSCKDQYRMDGYGCSSNTATS